MACPRLLAFAGLVRAVQAVDSPVWVDEVEAAAVQLLQSKITILPAPKPPALPALAELRAAAVVVARYRVATSIPLMVLSLGVVWLLGLMMMDLQGSPRPPPPKLSQGLAGGDGGGRAPRKAWQLLLDTDVLCLIFASFLNGGGAFMFLPQLPRMEVVYGASKVQVSLMMVCYGCGGMASSPLLGRLVDRHGGKPVLLRAMLLSGAAFLVCGLMQTLWQLLVARAFAGFFIGVLGVLSAIVAERTLPLERAAALALVGSGNSVGALLLPFLSGLLSTGDHDHGTLCYIFAAACLVTAFWSHRLQPGPPREKEQQPASAAAAASGTGWETMRQRPAVLLWFLIYGVEYSALPMMLNSGTFLLHDLYHASESLIGLSTVLAGAAVLLAALLLVGPTVARLGEQWTLVAALLLHGATSALVPAMPVLSAALVVGFVNAGFSAFLEPCIISSVSDLVPKDFLGTATGVFSALKAFGFVAGVLGASLLFQISLWVPYLLVAGVQAVSAAVVLAMMRGRGGQS